MSELVFVVPIKDVSGAKQRLASLMPQALRSELALRLLHRTLGDLARFAPEVDRLLVSDSPAMAAVAEAYGAAFLLEPEAAGETAAVERATRWSIDRGYRSQAVIPADMAELSEEDVRALIAAVPPGPGPSVVLCPAVGDDGTNAILAMPPDAIPYRFGARSFEGYRAAAAARGVECRVLRLPSFVLDLDTPEDVHAFIAASPRNPVARWLSEQLHLAAS
jgi:2-phospho-L-lactate guanylyltransferase